MENWLGGIGVGNRTALIPTLDATRLDSPWITTHNEFLQKFLELGPLGLIVFLAFLGALIGNAWWTARVQRDLGNENRRWFAVACLMALAIAPLFALQVDAFHFPLKGWWLTAGLVVVATRLTAEELARRQAAYA